MLEFTTMNSNSPSCIRRRASVPEWEEHVGLKELCKAPWTTATTLPFAGVDGASTYPQLAGAKHNAKCRRAMSKCSKRESSARSVSRHGGRGTDWDQSAPVVSPGRGTRSAL